MRERLSEREKGGRGRSLLTDGSGAHPVPSLSGSAFLPVGLIPHPFQDSSKVGTPDSGLTSCRFRSLCKEDPFSIRIVPKSRRTEPHWPDWGHVPLPNRCSGRGSYMLSAPGSYGLRGGSRCFLRGKSGRIWQKKERRMLGRQSPQASAALLCADGYLPAHFPLCK